MEWFCVALETVMHPESREPLIREGEVFSLQVFDNISRETGMDNVRVQLCTSLPAAWAMQADLYPDK